MVLTTPSPLFRVEITTVTGGRPIYFFPFDWQAPRNPTLRRRLLSSTFKSKFLSCYTGSPIFFSFWLERTRSGYGREGRSVSAFYVDRLSTGETRMLSSPLLGRHED